MPYIETIETSIAENKIMAQTARSQRIEARIAPDVLATVRHAVDIKGCSLSSFIVAAVEDAARRVIEENQIVRLSVEDQRRFAEALLDKDAKPAPAMVRAAQNHKRLFGES
ncbi:MAG: DUF1778 domain-containing protein [Pseudomonadota bacterium]